MGFVVLVLVLAIASHGKTREQTLSESTLFRSDLMGINAILDVLIKYSQYVLQKQE
ncbi:hypothetical protein [Planktothrix agardhii]|uniref:hypothetical protein n=1 Tax=Planktothrix agardhii TaxID=1160 RepID=UPI001F418AC8|nr:hypothetical protein [Planktothrix agardhii]MCF3623178.1 hypothetical protein [Planktothrix agardhii 1030]